MIYPLLWLFRSCSEEQRNHALDTYLDSGHLGAAGKIVAMVMEWAVKFSISLTPGRDGGGNSWPCVVTVCGPRSRIVPFFKACLAAPMTMMISPQV